MLYHYRYLNEKDLINLSCTNFIIHKIKLISETKFFNLLQIKWSAHKKWWFRKLISDDLKNDIFEYIEKTDNCLSKWNVRIIFVDKTENSLFTNKSKLIFDYFRIHKKLFEIYVELFFWIYDNFFNSDHDCLFSVDLKHVYFTINLNENIRFLFVFTIFDIKQFQSTKMLQNSKSINFIIIEIINRAFEKISK